MQCSLLLVFLRVYLYLSTESSLSYRLPLENLLNTNSFWEIRKHFRNTLEFHPDIQVGFRIHLLSFLSFSKQCAYRVFSFHYSQIHSGNPLIRLITYSYPFYSLSVYTASLSIESILPYRWPTHPVYLFIQNTHSYNEPSHTVYSFIPSTLPYRRLIPVV